MSKGSAVWRSGLWIDHHRLTARGLVVADVAEALRQGNVDIPSGRVESVDQEFSVRTPGELRTAEDFNALVIANFDGKPVRIRDVGKKRSWAPRTSGRS